MLRFGCSYQGIADSTCSATTIRLRRDEWIKAGVFAPLKLIALEAYDRIVGLLFDDLADAIITVRSLIRRAWTSHRGDTRPARRP